MSFPTLMPKEILKAVKVANAKINRDLNRQVILDDIANFDSDKVLDFITKVRHQQKIFGTKKKKKKNLFSSTKI